jgi:hypothetical protein
MKPHQALFIPRKKLLGNRSTSPTTSTVWKRFMISLPKNTELHLGQAITYAQVHTKLKYHLGAGIKAMNDQFFRIFKY